MKIEDINSNEIMKETCLKWHYALKQMMSSHLERVNHKIELIKEDKCSCTNQTNSDEDKFVDDFFYNLSDYMERLNEIKNYDCIDLNKLARITDKVIETDDAVIIESLKKAIEIHYDEAKFAYIYANFRGCVFHSATMLEAGMKLYIREAKLSNEFNKFLKGKFGTLGKYIEFFKSKSFFEDSIGLAEDVNNLRVDHIHIRIEEKPETYHDLTDRDEYVVIDPNDIKFTRNSLFMIDWEKKEQVIIFKYKKDAKKCFEKSMEMLKKINTSLADLDGDNHASN